LKITLFMYLIVGLGNPGKKYASTRHNVGWIILDYLISKGEKWIISKSAHALYGQQKIANQEVKLIKPTTFMNNSGATVAYAAKKHHLAPDQIIVIYDDKDIPLGKMKIQINRGPAGHNGVKSIIEHLKTKNFIRLRVGVQSAKTERQKAGQIVLKNLSAAEKQKIITLVPLVKEAIATIITRGILTAMSIFNKNSRG